MSRHGRRPSRWQGYTGTGSYILSAGNYVAHRSVRWTRSPYQMTHGFFGGNSHHFNVTQGGTITVDFRD